MYQNYLQSHVYYIQYDSPCFHSSFLRVLLSVSIYFVGYVYSYFLGTFTPDHVRHDVKVDMLLGTVV
jgi:hypothetical protein